MEIDVKLLEMGKRIINNKMHEIKDKDGKVIASDEMAIRKMVNSAFDENGAINNIQAYRDLNKLIVTTAQKSPKPDFQKLINLISKYEKVGAYDVKEYDVNDGRTRCTMALAASGSGVDFTKIPSYKRKTFATPRLHQFGAKYSISRMISDPINEFRNAVNYVTEAQTKYIISQIYALMRAAVTASKVPAKQIASAANVTIAQFRAVEASLLRYGRNVKPVMVADSALLQALNMKQAETTLSATNTTPLYLTDAMREHLLKDVEIDQISRTIAIPIDNPFVDRKNSKVDLPVNEGILVAGGADSPFRVTEFGDMKVLSDTIEENLESEEVNMKIQYKVDITLLLNEAVGYVKDTSVTL